MKLFSRFFTLLAAASLLAGVATAATEKRPVAVKTVHPSLLLTPAGVAEIRAAQGKNAAFDLSLDKVRAQAEVALSMPIVVPEPKDGGGGYSHEKHKDNYYAMFNCGVLYQLTGEERYAALIRDMLTQYAALYPTLSYHPVELSSTPGRLFWQTLNECVWLIHTSIAYDCVYDYLSEKDRALFEKNIFTPMAEFLMEGNKKNNETFNKMHNHGTWATAAVGMAGYVMGRKDLVDKSLRGSDLTGKNGGFIQQLDQLFSPDGYYTEGAYYQRYAIWPFVLFAQAIDNNQPDVKIFEYRDNILQKAVGSLLEIAYDGRFFMINDAMPKGYDAQELVYAVDIIYKANPANKQLLDVAARYQDRFLPTDAGYAVARDIALGQAETYAPRSVLLRDGAEGTGGGIAIFRGNEGQNSTVLMKATSHGLSHGHYDKLMIAYYDNGHPIIQDYGAARFVNIEAKYKGHYTPENKSFAMSTIAHNTVTADEKSMFGGDMKTSSKYSSSIYFYDAANPAAKITSAKETNAYPGIEMQRTVAYVETGVTQHPVIVDIFRIESPGVHQYDLPVYFNGQMISLNFPYTRATSEMKPLGAANGYRHLWKEAAGKNDKPLSTLTWLTGNRFYSITTATDSNSEMFMARTGANDPNFHLRSEPAYIVRQSGKSSHTFFSVIETHGLYDLVVEQTVDAVSRVTDMELLLDTPEYTVAQFTIAPLNPGTPQSMRVCVANKNADKNAVHKVSLPTGSIEWTGPYMIK